MPLFSNCIVVYSHVYHRQKLGQSVKKKKKNERKNNNNSTCNNNKKDIKIA